MQAMIDELAKQAAESLGQVSSKETLASFWQEYLSKNGKIPALMKNLRTVAPEERPAMGKIINELKQKVQADYDAAAETVKQAELAARNAAETVDITLPAKTRPVGGLHPLTLVANQIIDVFSGMGFAVADAPEIEDDDHNFTRLNVPKDHPARDMQDTFYLSDEFLLRTQTSGGQIRTMDSQKPPIKVLIPGRVFRSDSDATHSPMFHQMEGLVVDKGITLGEKEFTLNPNNLVICDAEKPVALAGIMGGANSGMDDNTTSLLFECATFARDSVRKTSRALGQNSDSSARYEKGVDRYSPQLGLARALHLIQQLDCGDITTLKYDLSDGRPLERKHIVTTPAKICGVLGITVPDQTMIDILQRLEFTVDVQADGSWDVSAPLYRDDVEGFPDLAEEVIREYGYDHIVPTFLNTASVTNGGLNYDQKQQLKTKRLLAAQGFYEASTLAFYSNTELDMLHIPAEDEARKAIRILNPISENLSIMRTLLTPSMLNVIVDNLKKGNAEGRLFEMAPVYLAKELPINEHPHERQTLCIGAFGPEEDFFTVKGALEALAAGFGLTFDYQRETAAWLHPGISAAVYCNGKRLGVFGKLANEINAELEIAKEQKDSQNIYLGELDYEALMSCVEGELRYKPLSPYAPVKRDLALVCGEAVSCGEIEETIRKASPLVSEVKLFDIYRGANLGEGKKSMAFSLSLSDPKKEVSAEEVERVVKKILGNLKFKLGIEIR